MGVHQLILCLGGNLGNKTEIFRETNSLIAQSLGNIIDESPVYQTPPWGFESENNFWNQVLRIETYLTPENVIKEIYVIESHFGRKRNSGRYVSRRMDIDILFYDDWIVQTNALTIPHPFISKRKFVLAPLNDIMPRFKDPVSGKLFLNYLQLVMICQKLFVLTPDYDYIPQLHHRYLGKVFAGKYL
jgi:2-amino-4-hydroxy-6-hydroxymethyldihydropteridine diphosphokinase